LLYHAMLYCSKSSIYRSRKSSPSSKSAMPQTAEYRIVVERSARRLWLYCGGTRAARTSGSRSAETSPPTRRSRAIRQRRSASSSSVRKIRTAGSSCPCASAIRTPPRRSRAARRLDRCAGTRPDHRGARTAAHDHRKTPVSAARSTSTARHRARRRRRRDSRLHRTLQSRDAGTVRPARRSERGSRSRHDKNGRPVATVGQTPAKHRIHGRALSPTAPTTGSATRRVASIANQMLSRIWARAGEPDRGARTGFRRGYATPKVDVRGALFQDQKILLVREQCDGLWSLPGGFADVGKSPSENIEKEIWEEATLKVKATALYAVRHKAKHEYDARRAGLLQALLPLRTDRRESRCRDPKPAKCNSSAATNCRRYRRAALWRKTSQRRSLIANPDSARRRSIDWRYPAFPCAAATPGADNR
jgi:ADP-ribose pyrophosphatase YjhB (NUDIX family)